MQAVNGELQEEPAKFEVTLYYNGDYYKKLNAATTVTERTRRRSMTTSSKMVASDIIGSRSNVDGNKMHDATLQPFSTRYSSNPSQITESLENLRNYQVHKDHDDISEPSLKVLLSDENWKHDCDLVADHLNKYREFYKILENKKKQLKREQRNGASNENSDDQK